MHNERQSVSVKGEAKQRQLIDWLKKEKIEHYEKLIRKVAN